MNDKVNELVEWVANYGAKYFDAGREWGKKKASKELVGQLEEDARKLLSHPDLALIEFYYHKDPDDDTGVRRARAIPLAEALKEKKNE